MPPEAKSRPLSPDPESLPPAGDLGCLDRIEDLSLLQSITLTPEQIDEQWLQAFDRHIALGSVSLKESPPPLRQHINTARSDWEAMLGLNSPSHSLYDAYTAIRKHRRHGLLPLQVLNTLRELSAISGSSEGAVQMVQQSRYLLSAGSRTLGLRYNYSNRLASALGWQGDTRQLVVDNSGILLYGHRKLAVIGQIASRFATAAQQNMPAQAVNKLIHNVPVEAHLEAIIQNGAHYIFGQKAETRSTRRLSVRLERLYKALEQPEVVEILGPRVLKAYFRYQQPSHQAQEKYPHLAALLPRPQPAETENKQEAPTPIVVDGCEPWLHETAIPENAPDKKRWLEELNACIARGSESLFHRTAKDRKRILGERTKFFRLLGWTDPGKDIGRAFEVFSTTYPQLASPQNAVDTLNILSWHEVHPLVPIITKRFVTILSTAEKM